MSVWTPECKTHGVWNASRESACPSCMVDGRKEIARLERELAEIKRLAEDVRLNYECMADGGFVRCLTCGSQESTHDMDIMGPLKKLLAAIKPPL